MEKSLQALNRQEKLAVWSERIAACRSSGIGVKYWCEGNGISTPATTSGKRSCFLLRQGTIIENTPQFAEVCVAPAAKISATVHLGDVSVDIHSGADAETTAMLLRVLQSC